MGPSFCFILTASNAIFPFPARRGLQICARHDPAARSLDDKRSCPLSRSTLAIMSRLCRVGRRKPVAAIENACNCLMQHSRDMLSMLRVKRLI